MIPKSPCTIAARILRLSTVLLFLGGMAMPAFAEVPRFTEFGGEVTRTASAVGEGQLAVLHHPSRLLVGDAPRDVRFATSMAVVHASVADIEATVLGFDQYAEFVPQAKEVKLRGQSLGEYLVDYTLEFELPIRNLTLDYILHYKRESDGSIRWDLIRGDFEGTSGRWEFFALDENRTFVVYTAWSDLDSMGFTMRLMLRAQSDLRVALPVVNTSIVLEAVRRRAEGRPAEDSAPSKVSRTQPTVPLVSSAGQADRLEAVRALAHAGTVLMIYPRQWIMTSEGPLDLIFVGAVVLVDSPIIKTRHYAQQFPRYGEFFDQIRKATMTEAEDETLVNWSLGLGFGFLSVRLDYTLGYTRDTNPNVLAFTSKHGDFEHVYGAWEWIPLDDSQSLVAYTTVSESGANAPAILRLQELLPNRKVTVGVATAGVVAENIGPWIEGQPDISDAKVERGAVVPEP